MADANAARRVGRPKGTGSRHIYDILRTRILSLEMPPGSGIDESDLVAEFGVSRTPVREALIRLATDGYVTILPNLGASVSPLDLDEIPELLAAMELCLRVTSRWAAVRRSDDDVAQMWASQAAYEAASGREDYFAMSEANHVLHLVIAKGSRNRYFVRMYTGLTPQYNRLSLTLLSAAKTAGPAYKAYFNKVTDDHRRLIAAIQARDAAAADRLAQTHAHLVAERLQSFIWQSLADPITLGNPPRAPSGRARNVRPGKEGSS